MFTKRCALASVAASMGVIIQLTPAMAQSYGLGGVSSGGNYTNVPPSNTTVYVPAGLILHAKLSTSISTDAARPGDLVQAELSEPIILANGTIPAGTILQGTVTQASSGGFMGRSGRLTLKFDRMRTGQGLEVPIATHIMGDLGNYRQIANGSQSFAGERAPGKVGQALVRTAIGAGAGAALGTAVGAIAGRGTRVAYEPVYAHGYGPVGYTARPRSGAALGAGTGAWSGAAIGGGVGLADALILRKGKQVVIPNGTPFQLQLDAPVTLSQPLHQYGYM